MGITGARTANTTALESGTWRVQGSWLWAGCRCWPQYWDGQSLRQGQAGCGNNYQ